MQYPVLRRSLAALAVLAACSSRQVAPSPSGSPVRVESTEGQRVTVGTVLREDPPMPGEETPAWQGIDPAAVDAGATADVAQTEAPHAHH